MISRSCPTSRTLRYRPPPAWSPHREMVGPLMLWDRAQHLPQPLQALPRVARLTERGLYRLVLRREVGRHDVSAERPRHTPEADREEHRGGERESSQGRIPRPEGLAGCYTR